jgi:hypothetical protein
MTSTMIGCSGNDPLFWQMHFAHRHNDSIHHQLLFFNLPVPTGHHLGHFSGLPGGTDKCKPFSCLKLR